RSSDLIIIAINFPPIFRLHYCHLPLHFHIFDFFVLFILENQMEGMFKIYLLTYLVHIGFFKCYILFSNCIFLIIFSFLWKELKAFICNCFLFCYVYIIICRLK